MLAQINQRWAWLTRTLIHPTCPVCKRHRARIRLTLLHCGSLLAVCDFGLTILNFPLESAVRLCGASAGACIGFAFWLTEGPHRG